MTDAFWAAIAAIAASVSTAISVVLVAKVNSAHSTAVEARDTAAEAREMARPVGNGYADESRAAWARIERQLDDLAQRHVKTNAWLVRHLSDHARAHVHHHDEHREEA